VEITRAEGFSPVSRSFGGLRSARQAKQTQTGTASANLAQLRFVLLHFVLVHRAALHHELHALDFGDVF
jgi:hypothetical protein